MRQTAISFDQFVNCFLSWVLCFGGGWADETFSARCWREGKTGGGWNAARAGVDLLFSEIRLHGYRPVLVDVLHCFESYLSEAERKQLPDVYR